MGEHWRLIKELRGGNKMKKILYKKIKLVTTMVVCLMFIATSMSLLGETSPDGRDENVFLTSIEPEWNLVSAPYDTVINKTYLIVNKDAIEYTWSEAVGTDMDDSLGIVRMVF